MKIEIDDPKIIKLQEQGKTVVFTIVDEKLGGAFALADKIRVEFFREVARRALKYYDEDY